jgi:Xaa-Pro aminopeptidase
VPVVESFDVARSLEFDRSEYEARVRRLAEHVGGDADVVVVLAPHALRYFSGYRSLLAKSTWRPLALCLPTDGSGEPFLCIPEQDHGVATATSWVELCVTKESVRHGHEDPIEVLCDQLRERGFGDGRIGLELGFGQRLGMTPLELDQFRGLLSGATIVDASDALWATRAVKSAAEIDCLRTACEISCQGVRTGFEAMRAGMTERDAHRVMVESMIHEGAEEVWLTFGSGAKGYAAFNSYPSDRVLEPGHLVWVDGGAIYRGYVCDYIRTAVVAEPSPDQLRWFEAALGANRAAVAALRPNVPSSEVFAAARGYIEEAGMLGAWGLDVLGHGVGVQIHELPSITEGSDEPLVPGNVVTIEPSLSPPRHEHGHYIVEEVIAIGDSGTENLTASLPGDLWVTEG